MSRKYGEKWGLRPLSAGIADGDFVSLLGPNGAGKSTLMKLLSQQAKPTGGEIRYNGEALKTAKDRYRAKIGVISHLPFLYSGLSAFENLMFYAELYGITDARARSAELLRRVELNKRMHDPVRTYSRGMLQRASIARALLNSPELIFLDEPYTGLDRQASYMLTDILKEQIGKHTTIVLITHDLAQGYSLADKIMILCRGECKFYGGKAEFSESEFERKYLEITGCE